MSDTSGLVHYVEIVTTDVDGACGHYQQILGQEFGPPTPELGGARVAQLPEGATFGIRAPMHEQETPVTRTYFRVGDLAAAVADAASRGAEIALPPMELPGHGRIAIYILGGVQQGLWEWPLRTK